MAIKIRSDDEVIVIAGKDKGKRGKVTKVFPAIGKAIVSGVNFVKKHQKPVPSMNKPGGVLKKEAAIDISNIAIFNSNSKKADRIGFKLKDSKKIRIFKSNGESIKIK